MNLSPKNTYKEARMASIEVLFHFFKAVPSSYYVETEEKNLDGTVTITKNEIQTIRKELDRSVTGFDYIEITGMYLSAYDQKIFRAIMQSVNKQKEELYESNMIEAKSLNEEYLPVRRELYSNQAQIGINEFYQIINPNTRPRASKEIYSKIINSLNRLAHVTLSLYTKDKRNIITAPLLIFLSVDNRLNLQLNPALLSYQYESKNQHIIKPKQSYYILNNSEYYDLGSDLQRLLYSKIQYRFASMPQSHKECRFEFDEILSQLFVKTESKKSKYNQSAKLKRTIAELNNHSSYTLTIEGSKTLYIVVNR
ncbi:hypothetical protein [Sulfurimonas xiamenensis]|uniref:Uncharacterized protein n=1 Tax=Sulfurimonas xiamenensis TaxID=2590021 RepID=A0AAJ4A4F9_9BACT|nr:hypothetical protein [Sulfurimonas xiamenensis]QFR43766.1 hypothetical protein FJR47_07520 [Sulfurimonas xiamenensis]